MAIRTEHNCDRCGKPLRVLKNGEKSLVHHEKTCLIQFDEMKPFCLCENCFCSFLSFMGEVN